MQWIDQLNRLVDNIVAKVLLSYDITVDTKRMQAQLFAFGTSYLEWITMQIVGIKHLSNLLPWGQLFAKH